jgi:WD40 repeat protein
MSLPVESMSGKHEASKLSDDDAGEVILATAGYDHTIKFWQAHTGTCLLTLQHPDSHVNAMEISPDGQVSYFSNTSC